MNKEAEFNFEVDEETKRLLELSLWCLISKFGMPFTSAITAIEDYHTLDHPFDTNEDWYHHEGPYWIALRIFHRQSSECEQDFHLWRVAKGFTHIPDDVIRSMRRGG